MRFYIWNRRSIFQHGWTMVPKFHQENCSGVKEVTLKAFVHDFTICLVLKKEDIKSKATAIRCFFRMCVDRDMCFCWNLQMSQSAIYQRGWYVFWEMNNFQVELIWVDHMHGIQVIHTSNTPRVFFQQLVVHPRTHPKIIAHSQIAL